MGGGGSRVNLEFERLPSSSPLSDLWDSPGIPLAGSPQALASFSPGRDLVTKAVSTKVPTGLGRPWFG